MVYGNPYAAGSGFPVGPMQQVNPLQQLPFGLAQYAGKAASLPMGVSPVAPPQMPQQQGLLGQAGGMGGLQSLLGMLGKGSPTGAGGLLSGANGMFGSPEAAAQFAASRGFGPAMSNASLPWLQGILGSMPASI